MGFTVGMEFGTTNGCSPVLSVPVTAGIGSGFFIGDFVTVMLWTCVGVED